MKSDRYEQPLYTRYFHSRYRSHRRIVTAFLLAHQQLSMCLFLNFKQSEVFFFKTPGGELQPDLNVLTVGQVDRQHVFGCYLMPNKSTVCANS